MSNGVNILNESQASVVLVKLDGGDIGQESGLLPVRSETLLGSDARTSSEKNNSGEPAPPPLNSTGTIFRIPLAIFQSRVFNSVWC